MPPAVVGGRLYGVPMLDHLGLQVADVAATAALIGRVLAPAGVQEAVRFPGPDGLVVGFAGPDGQPKFWLSSSPRDVPGRETHVAFSVPDRATVNGVHDAVRAEGAEVLHAPREFPEYHPGYYAVFFRDLDGNNLEAVCHR